MLLARWSHLPNSKVSRIEELRAALRHARGNRLSALGNHKEALEEARQAVALRRGLIGAERELISSLYLVEQELKRLGQVEEAKVFASEAELLTEKVDDPHFRLAYRAAARRRFNIATTCQSQNSGSGNRRI